MVKQFLTTSAIVLALAGPALAQGAATTPSATDTPPSKTATPSASTGGVTTTDHSNDRATIAKADDSAVEKMKPDQMRASKIIGKNIYGPDNKSIGDISDLVLDKDGKVDKVVLSVGGFLGIGDKHVAVPMSELKHGENDRLVINMTKDQLQQAPKYEYADRDTGARSGSSTAPAPGAAGSTNGRTR